MRRPHWVALSFAFVALGCTDLTSPSRLDGKWGEEISIPGNGLTFTLATNGDAITGSGSWTGEACCGGPVTIAGTTARGDVTLTLSFVANGNVVAPFSETFTGRLSDANTLSGEMSTGAANAAPVIFRRIR